MDRSLGNIFQKKEIAALLLAFFVLFQMAYSFRFPSVGTNENWLPISSYLNKFSVKQGDSALLAKVSLFISPDYRLNSDVGAYLELAKDFSPRSFKGNAYLNRPLYIFLAFIAASVVGIFAPVSYGVIFAIYIILNFFFLYAGALLFFLMLRKIFSFRVAFLSSFLLIFSPFSHSFLTQPMPHVFMIFAVALSLYLLYDYFILPSSKKLIVFSFIIGILMLGKMLFSIPIFFLFLAVFYKRYKESIVFLAVLFIPYLIWYVLVTKIWGIDYYFSEAVHYRMGVWVFESLFWPWYEFLRVYLAALPDFISTVIYAFLVLPLAFAIAGFKRIGFENKNLLVFGFIISIFLLSFGMNLYLYRISFLVFPVIYPLAVIGMGEAAGFWGRYDKRLYNIVYAASLILIVGLSSVDIYNVFQYLN